MKKRILLVILLLLAAYKAMPVLKPYAENILQAFKPGTQAESDESAGEQPEPAATAPLSAGEDRTASREPDKPPSGGQTIHLANNQLYKGDLILVNQNYKLHKEGVMTDIVKLSSHPELQGGYGLLDNGIELSASITEHFSQMVTAAGKSGVNHFLISSGYRDFEKQDELYNQMGSDSALPAGYSEHNSGLALDIGSTEQQMSQAPEGKWLKKNAWKFGFILRYPEDKTAITGIKYEPWHFRYVGLPHSALMMKQNLTLEEYLDYIREKGKISVNVEGKDYEVLYIPASKKMSIQIPSNQGYTISGDNRKGYIVTLIRD